MIVEVAAALPVLLLSMQDHSAYYVALIRASASYIVSVTFIILIDI